MQQIRIRKWQRKIKKEIGNPKLQINLDGEEMPIVMVCLYYITETKFARLEIYASLFLKI